MKRVLKYILYLLFAAFSINTANAQSIAFKSFRQTDGVVTQQSKGLYVWGAWEQSSTVVVLDMSNNYIVTDDQLNKKVTVFEIFDKPQKWIVKKDYKYLNYECMTNPQNYNDLIVRIGGFSAYFVQLSAGIQDDVIYRSEFSF